MDTETKDEWARPTDEPMGCAQLPDDLAAASPVAVVADRMTKAEAVRRKNGGME